MRPASSGRTTHVRLASWLLARQQVCALPYTSPSFEHLLTIHIQMSCTVCAV